MTSRIAPLAATSLLALGSLNAWLLAGVSEDYTEKQAAVEKTEWAPNLPQSTTELPKPKPINAYSQTLARPIFLKTREPFVPPPPTPPPLPKTTAAPPPVVVDPGLVLGGIMIASDAKKAYLFSKADSQGTWMSEGETIMGWKLHSIDPTSTRLQQADRTIELWLYPPGP